MGISPRQELLKIQKNLWRRNKEIIENSIVVKERGFSSYESRYKKRVASYSELATYDDMIDAVAKAQVVYVGDYHTCNQSQRSFLRLLKTFIQRDKKLLLGLELIHRRHQSVIDNYLAGGLTEDEFIKKVGLRQHWVFDLWENFKPLFDFALYHKLPIAGIDAAGRNAGLVQRDLATAKLIVELCKKHPDRKIFILIGDLHLAHLPEQVRKLSGGSLKDLTLFQNSDSIYWDLAEKGLDHRIELVKIDDSSFCRMHTPPIVCQQSYINWLEHEEGEIDFADSRASFLDLVDHISSFLGIDLKDEREKVDVYTCGDLSFLQQLKGQLSAKELSGLKRQISASESYFIPEKRIVYLANLSVNHAAEEAAHFIKHVLGGREFKRTHEDAFFANILHEGLAFFGSKLINPKRKCFHEKEFQNLIAYFSTIRVPQERRSEFETACIVLDFLKREPSRPDHGRIIRALRPDLFFSVTHGLGYMLGDRLFYAVMSEQISKSEVRELMKSNWKKEGEASIVYFDLYKRLKKVKMPKRI